MKNFRYSTQTISKKDIANVSETLKSEFLTQGPKTNEFEKKINFLAGSKYSLATNIVSWLGESIQRTGRKDCESKLAHGTLLLFSAFDRHFAVFLGEALDTALGVNALLTAGEKWMAA